PYHNWRRLDGYPVPSNKYGRSWDLAPVPVDLLPRDLARPIGSRPVKPCSGLSPYGEAALDAACRRIVAAPNGQQRSTLNAEAYSIGPLAGADALPSGSARRVLIYAATQMPSLDSRRPWRPGELEKTAVQGFEDGLAHPRGRSHG